MTRPEYELFYGGAAGGGKSDYLLCEGLRQVHLPNYNGIIFRKTFPQLTEIVDRSQFLYKRAFPGAKYNDSKHVWIFPSGAKIYFGNMQHSSDKINYQGKRYDFIGFDELTQFTWEEYSYLYSRNRPSGPGTKVYRRATGNPGGIGHGWVKAYFVKAAPPMTRINQKIRVPNEEGKLIEFERSRIFIPSKVWDNRKLLDADPNYVANLSLMDEADQKALLEGDWDTFEGQVFMEWRDDPANYQTRRWTHVIDDFFIDSSWKVFRSFDFGYAKPFSVGWTAVDHAGRMYRIKEYYGCTRQPNTGIKITPQEIARGIKEIEATDPNLSGRHITGIADPAIWDKSHGESIAEMMEQEHVYFSKGDHARLAGKMQFHYRLAFDSMGLPMFYVFKSCKDFIRTIPNLVYDEKKVEDIDTDGEDHIYDEQRYLFMEHPLNPRKNEIFVPPAEDPLNLWADRYRYK